MKRQPKVLRALCGLVLAGVATAAAAQDTRTPTSAPDDRSAMSRDSSASGSDIGRSMNWGWLGLLGLGGMFGLRGLKRNEHDGRTVVTRNPKPMGA